MKVKDVVPYLALGVAIVALIIASIGCSTPAVSDPEPVTTAIIIDKDYSYVTVSIDADKAGTVEVWCNGQFAGSINYDAGNHVYKKQMNEFISSKPITSLSIKYRH